MAKKSYQKLNNCYNAEIKESGPEKSVITFKGVNSKGTETIVTVTVEDYFFPYMIKDMAKIARRRKATAEQRLLEVVKAAGE